MKKFLTVVLACTMLFGFSAAASAQGFDAGVKLGYQTLTGDWGDAMDGAFAGGLYGAYGLSPNVSLVGSWTYSKHKTGDDASALANLDVAAVDDQIPLDAQSALGSHLSFEVAACS